MPFFLLVLFSLGLVSCHNTPSKPSPIPPAQTSFQDSSLLPSYDSIITTADRPEEEVTEESLDLPILSSSYRPKDDHFPSFDRSPIETKLQNKVAQGDALVVHVFVPLCDNEHQGIVKTSSSLGNGFSLRTNLYWATSTGMKRYFKEKKSWTLLQSIKDVYQDSVVLERVVFRRQYPNKATVYLVADAYRGDKMLETVNHFFRAMSNNYSEKMLLQDSSSIGIHGSADLVVFNGHNGLLDLYEEQPEVWYNNSATQKDMVAIACFANEYFEREARRAQAYPLIRAKSTLHPGAFILSAIIDDWAMLKTVESMRLSAGRAYCKVHNCSIKTSKNLFYKGWRSENLSSPSEPF